MSFTVAYNIKAIDQFTSVADKIRQSLDKMERSAATLNAVQAKAATISAAHAAKVKTQSDAVKSLGYNTKLGAIESNMLSDKFRKNASSLSALNALTLKNISATKLAAQKQRDMKRALSANERQTREANRAMRSSISIMGDMGTKANQVGNFMMTRVALPLIGASALFKKSSDEFNKDMADVGSLIPGQTEKLKRYKNEVLGMATAYGKSDLSAVAKGLYQDISNLGDSEDTIKKLDIAMRSSVAGRAMEADAMNLLSGVSADYGDTSAKMMQRVSDLAFKTVELGSTTFPELAQQMGRTTTQAKMMGVSVEELFGQYAGLTSGTVRTDMVSTRLAGVFAALGKRTGPIVDVMKKMGVASGKDLIAKFGGLQGALFALRREVGNDEIAFSKLFEDQEGRLGALAMTGAKAKEVAREISLMGQSAGATEIAFKAQTEGIGASAFKADQTRAKFARLRVEWGDKLIPIADKLMDRADELINWLSNLDDDTVETITNVGLLAIKIGLVSKAIGGVMSVSGGMSKMFMDLGNGASVASGKYAKFGKVAGGIGPVFAAAAAGWAVGEIINESIINPMVKATDALQNKIISFVDTVNENFDRLKGGELDEKAAEARKKFKKTQGFGYWALSKLDPTGEMEERKDQLMDVMAKLEAKQAIEKNKYLQSKREDLLSLSENLMDAQDMNDLWGAPRGGGGTFPGAARKDVLEIRVKGESGGTVTEVRHVERSQNKSVELGSNT